MPAVGAGFDVSTERGGAAMFDRRHDLELMQAQMPGMRGAIRGPCSPEDVGDLERGAHQPQPSGGSSMGDASASLSSGLVTLRVSPEEGRSGTEGVGRVRYGGGA